MIVNILVVSYKKRQKWSSVPGHRERNGMNQVRSCISEYTAADLKKKYCWPNVMGTQVLFLLQFITFSH